MSDFDYQVCPSCDQEVPLSRSRPVVSLEHVPSACKTCGTPDLASDIKFVEGKAAGQAQGHR